DRNRESGETDDETDSGPPRIHDPPPTGRQPGERSRSPEIGSSQPVPKSHAPRTHQQRTSRWNRGVTSAGRARWAAEGEEAATIRIRAHSLGEGAGDGEACEMSSLRRGYRGSELSVLWRRAPCRCG